MITFPSSIIPSDAEWGLLSNVQTFTSPLTQSAQTLRLPGERWRFTFTYSALTEEQSAQMAAFIVQARGGAERFTASNPMKLSPTGAGGGTPLVKGASQTGASLATDGWPLSTTVLKTGDFFQVNGELKMVVGDVTSDGSGNATITFEPALRASPPDNDPIVTSNPATTFRLVDPEQSWRYLQGYVSSFTVNAVESWL